MDVAIHPRHFGQRLEERDDRRVLAGQRRQRGLVMRVGQAAHIEHEIGIQRHAVLEAERLEQQRELRRIDGDQVLDPATQRRGRQVAGVESKAEFAGLGQQVAFVVDGLGERARVARKRMPAARFREPLDQRVDLGVEVEKAHIPPGATRMRDGLRESGQARPGLDVERHRHAVLAAGGEMRDRLRQQRGRQVVDRVIAGILERGQRHALARSGNAADEQQIHASCRRPSASAAAR